MRHNNVRNGTFVPLVVIAAHLAFPVPSLAQDTAQQSRAEVLATQNAGIRIGDAELALRPDFLEDMNAALTADDGQPFGMIVRLDEPLTPETRTALEEAGTSVEEYLGGTTYLMFVQPTSSLDRLGGIFAAQSASGAVMSVAAKIQARVNEPIIVPDELQSPDEPIVPALTVQFFSTVPEEAARAALEERGFAVIDQLSPTSFVVEAEASAAEDLATLPIVKLIDQGPLPFLPLNATGRRNANTDLAQLFSLPGAAPAYQGVTGAGIRIGVADSGVDQDHEDFAGVDASGGAGATRVYNPRPGSGSHGTHVASIVGGSGLNADANGRPAFSTRGHAPQAEIGDYAQMGSSNANYHAAINGDGTDVSNHSYVQSFDGYGTAAQQLDTIVRGDAVHDDEAIPARPQVWAAGNNGSFAQYGNEEGYYGLFTSAKNTISVGSSDSLDNRMSDFSSLGPTFDGRIKPDVVAPGCIDSIASPSQGILAASNNTQGYTGKCGTSMAAPVVAGILGLMMEARQTAASSTTPLYPSTYKALLVQTARDMIKTGAFADREFDNPDTEAPLIYHAGPDFATGFGMVDAAAAVAAVSDASRWRQSSAGATGEVDTHCIGIPAGTDELRVTLAWDDEPGSIVTTSTTPKLVNDLDLELVAPDGTVYRPWTLDPLPFTSSPGGGDLDPIDPADVVPARRDVDRLNNVELASVPLPASGQWKVRVRAFNLPNANAQPYSLAASHGLAQFCGPIIVVPICQRHPWICREFDERERPIVPIDWRRPVPVDDICKYVIDCPGCKGIRSGAYCPGWQMNFDNLPQDARITVFDNSGRIQMQSKPGMSIIKIDERRVGTDSFIAITDAKGRPFEKPFKPGIKMMDAQ